MTTPKELASLISDIADGSKAAVIVTVTSRNGEELKRYAVTSTRHTEDEIAFRVRGGAAAMSGFLDVTDLPTLDDVDRAAYHAEEETQVDGPDWFNDYEESRL